MRAGRWVSALAATLVVALAQAQAAAQPAQPLLLGSVAMDVPAEMVRRLSPLARYLSAQTGLPVEVKASPTMDAAISELGSGDTRIAYMTPVAYVEAHKRYGVRPLVAPLTAGRSTFHLLVVVREDSPLKSASDLKGRTFAFGDERALLQRAVVVGAGVGLTQLSGHAFLRHYDNVAKAVLNADFDAGILTNGSYREFAPRGLRTLHTSPALPPYVFAVDPRMPAELVHKLRAAFLALSAEQPHQRAVLEALGKGYDGFAPAHDADYDVVRRLIAPFANR